MPQALLRQLSPPRRLAPVEALVKSYSLAHLADQTLSRDLAALLARDRDTTASLLAHLAEFDARRLYLPAGYPSMFTYCVHELHLCEQAAFTRIRAARAARQFPGIFPALAAGRLHLSAAVLLTPHLTQENAEELLGAAAHKSKAEIEQLLAQRFPRPDVAARVQALSTPLCPRFTGQEVPGIVESPSTPAGGLLAPGLVEGLSTQTAGQLFPGIVEPSSNRPIEETSAPMVQHHAAGRMAGVDRPRLTPLAPRRFALQLTMSQELHDKLRYAQELLSHQVPSGDVAEVLERALDALIPRLEKRKFAATGKPRRGTRRSTANPRYVPAHVKRAVWERDGGRCTFVSDSGRRCPARTLLEFDHLDEVARGGRVTIGGMRLRCRAHNQYGAERTFGVEFMRRKRDEARRATAARAQAAAKERAEEVIPWLRALGFRADEARHAAAQCETIPEASLEQRVRLALTRFGPRTITKTQTSSSCQRTRVATEPAHHLVIQALRNKESSPALENTSTSPVGA